VFKNAAILFLYAESPVHFGSGASLGPVDLPIQRERHTLFPIGQASGIKGAMRDFVEQKTGVSARKMALRTREQERDAALDEATRAAVQTEVTRLEQELNTMADAVVTVFGPDRDASAHGGALAFKDARVLLFPVRSLKGVFAYVTCPTLIEGFKRDVQHVLDASSTAVQDFADMSVTGVEPDQCAMSSTDLIVGNKVVLEDFAYTVPVQEDATGSVPALAEKLAAAIFPPPAHQPGQAAVPDPYQYWREKIKSNLVVLHDDAFRDFAQLATEVVTRIKISDETGTVAQGALFTEEHLPSETVLYSLALATDGKKPNGNAPPLPATQILETFRGCVPPFTHGVFNISVRFMIPTVIRVVEAACL